MSLIEYRLRPITRYVVTRYETEDPREDGCASAGVSSQCGEYQNADVAYEVGYALARAEHERLGYPPGDDRIRYPEPPLRSGPILTDGVGNPTRMIAEPA